MTYRNWINTSPEDYTPNWVSSSYEDSLYNPNNIKRAEEYQRQRENQRRESLLALGINPETNQLIPSGTENDYLPTYDLESYIMEEQKKLDIINTEVQAEHQKASRIAVKILNKEELTDDDRLFLINKLK